MNPFRPYKTKHDFIREDTTKGTLEVTLNLFDVITWMECDNQEHKFYDEVLRTEVICHPNNSFYIRNSYREFDAAMTQFKEQYQMLDKRSLGPAPMSDKLGYKGPIKATINMTPGQVACVFHRKGYEVTDYDDAVFNCLFSNITPLN